MGKGGFAGGKGAVPTEPEQVEVHLFGKRVDVTSFLRKHPGGAKALKIFKDRDATEQFLMYHSPSRRERPAAGTRRARWFAAALRGPYAVVC